MSNPLLTNLPDPSDAGLRPFEFLEMPIVPDTEMPSFDQELARTTEDIIAQMLDWCSELFGASRARFIRPMASGDWLVYTRQPEQTSVVTHLADQAEIAMAYTVGLSKQPLVVTRPRISRLDGSGLRPIALKGYLGIPIVCQDRLVGIVEFAGDIRSDMESALFSAEPRLANIGERLLFDPGLHQSRTPITTETCVVLAGGVWSRGNITIQPDEFALLAIIDGPMTIADLANAADRSEAETLTVATSLLERGLLSIGPR